jgi:glycosyltransferase involved in cell wall biosynthesis
MTVIGVSSIYHAAKRQSDQYLASWIRFAQLPGNFGLATAGYGLAVALRKVVTQLHRRFPVNLIHAHAALPCGHAAALLSRHLGIPYVVTVHGLDVFNHCFENGLAAKWRHHASQRVYQGAGSVICISEKVRNNLICDGGEFHAEVVYNGVDPGFFSPLARESHEASPPSLLIVGTLLAGKGPELVLRAIAELQELHPALQCNIIGEGADRGRFVSLAQQLQIAERVHFLGRRNRAEVAAAMRQCTIFVLPSRYEGLGCVYLEAMACGKPAIGCLGQGIDEIIKSGSNGWLIASDALDQLVEALRVLLADAELRTRIGQSARQTILENYTLQHQARRLMRIFEGAAL